MDVFLVVLLCAISFSAGNLFQLFLRSYIEAGDLTKEGGA